MPTSKVLNPRYLLPFLILGASVILSYSIIVKAQTPVTHPEPTDEEIAAKGITFPIPELGNCADKNSCRDYCNQPGNMSACIKFAEDHGLMNKDEASQAEKFRSRLQSGGGPGGCSSPQSCETFCSNVNNLDTCVAFAEKHGFKEGKIEEAKKIQGYLKSGGQMPGGCTSEVSCRAYCGDFSHAQECFEFAQKSGITQVKGEAKFGEEEGTLSSDQFQKFIELAKKGETPGGCTSKDQCESYCQESSHFNECVSFGEKLGFIDSGQAEMIRKTGGKGPGGCNSESSCRNYCNDSAHQEECFKFAEEHGFIDKEDIKHTKEGFVRLRQGLEQAPPEVVACLKSTLGPNIIEDIQSGKLTPGPEIGDRVKSCFEKFGHRGDPKEAFSQAPPEIHSCLLEKLGDSFEKIKSGEVMPTPEMGDAFRVCGEQFRLIKGGGPQPQGGPEGGHHDFGGFLRTAPPGVATCLQEQLGDNFEKIKAGEIKPGPEIAEKFQGCFSSFQPGNFPSRENEPSNNEGIRPASPQEIFEKFAPPGGLIHPPVPSSTGGCQPRPACLDSHPACLIAQPAEGWCQAGAPLPQPGPSGTGGCQPRPACLDLQPRCLIPEPAGGWCPSPNSINQFQPTPTNQPSGEYQKYPSSEQYQQYQQQYNASASGTQYSPPPPQPSSSQPLPPPPPPPPPPPSGTSTSAQLQTQSFLGNIFRAIINFFIR